MRAVKVLSVLALFLCSTLLFAGTTGKISGTVTDAKTGEKLPGVNVVIEGTKLGATTNPDGFYTILNVPPGGYRLKASLVGYAASTVTGVRVNIDQTTSLDVTLNEATITTKEVTIVATRPVVEKDVSASRQNLNMTEIENLPVASVSAVVGLQAGIQGLTIRGGGSHQTAFMMDGLTLRDERDNSPFTAVAYTSVEDIQIQTGGFNAEYGNIRSGMVNFVTKDPKNYSFSLFSRYSPPQQKHFGRSPNDPMTYWVRPAVDPAVCWTGTKNGAWDLFTQQQYPEFEGWISVANKTLKDNDPTNDLTPQAAQRVYLWQHRKLLDIDKPDYNVDASFGGPVPGISEQLGNLRFFASYREVRTMLIIPLQTPDYRTYTGQLKLTSEIGEGMKLMVEGLYGEERGTNSSRAGGPGAFSSPEGIAAQISNGPAYLDARIFTTDYWNPTKITRNMFGARFTHNITPHTFYEASIQQFTSNYSSNPGRLRDTSRIYLFGNDYWVDEAPFGYQPNPSTGIGLGEGGGGLRMGVGMSNSRDSSKLSTWTGRFDFTSQLDRYNQLKTGLEFVYVDNKVIAGCIDIFLPSGRFMDNWHTFPKRGALYVQDKLEYEGMIANIGLRLDYSYAGGYWYGITNPFDLAFSGAKSLGIDTLLQHENAKQVLELSPRLGVAFPISVNSKLFFNYGHFRQIPTPANLFLLRRYLDNNMVTWIADPNNPLMKTVSYELGYEHNLFDQFLLRVAGYYKDVSDQPNSVNYVNRNRLVNYNIREPNSYEDIRGFEISLNKNRGNWIQGFVNYTYMVATSGYFGFMTYYENPTEQRTYERNSRQFYQSKPIPQPYARANIDIFTPPDFGPRFSDISLLGDWRLTLLGVWNSGAWFTWTGGGDIPGVQYNVHWRDYLNLDLRLTKSFRVSRVNVQLFVDMSNALNFKHFANSGSVGYGFVDGRDRDAYMKSLHLPADIGDKLQYGNIPGDDLPGDYRTGPFTPMVWVPNTGSVASPEKTAIYYDASTKSFMQYVNNQWAPVEQSRLDEINKNRSYIDMPNEEYFTFLNPRQIFWGLRLSINL